jgi:dystonin
MEAVADIFDRDGDNYINYQEFVAALRPDRDQGKPVTESRRIQDEVKRQASQCTCTKQFRIHKIGEGKYRVSGLLMWSYYFLVWDIRKKYLV